MAYIRKTKDVHISPKLLEVLTKISNKSDVAKRLLKTKISKEELVDEPVDYLSISKKDPSKISYAYPEKLEKIENPEEYWTFKGRVEAKPASAVKKVLKDVTEKELDLFTSLFKAAVTKKDLNFQIVQGEDIKKYYNGNSYSRGYGSLANSCMKYDHCKSFFTIYSDNPETCQMVILLDADDMLIGRALIWNAVNVETGDEVKVMDRIYCMDDDKNLHYFREWADENGYIYRKNQKWADCLRFISNGKELTLKLSIKINKNAYPSFPYVDTFKFWDEKNGNISNFLPQDNGYLRVLTSNDGRAQGPKTLMYDNLQGVYENTERLVRLDYPINGENWNVLGELVHYSEFQDLYMLKEHCTWSDEVEDYILKDEFAQYNNQELMQERKNYIQSKKNKGQLSGDKHIITKAKFDEWADEDLFADDFDFVDEDNNIEPVQPEPMFARPYRLNIDYGNIVERVANEVFGVVNQVQNPNGQEGQEGQA